MRLVFLLLDEDGPVSNIEAFILTLRAVIVVTCKDTEIAVGNFDITCWFNFLPAAKLVVQAPCWL